jgi:hypothetical protein
MASFDKSPEELLEDNQTGSTPRPSPAKRGLQSDNRGPLKKRAATSKASRAKSKRGASVVSVADEPASRSVCVTGHYAIAISEVASHHKFDTSNYTLTLFRYTEENNTQIYANFKFDHLEGIMRLMPKEIFDAKGDARWNSEDFVAFCGLPENSYPSPDSSQWLMRWRGIDGGMRLNERVGGEPWNAAGTFNFKFDSSTPEDGVGLTFNVVFAYDCKLFSFTGIKVGDLDAGVQADNSISLQERWDSLENPAWYEDEEEELEIEMDDRSRRDTISGRMELLASVPSEGSESPQKTVVETRSSKRGRNA